MLTRMSFKLRKLSHFQRTFVKLLLRTDNLAETKKGAEDLCQSVDWTAFEGQPSPVQEILDRYGLSLQHLLEDYLVPMLDATKTLVFSHKGIVRDRWVVSHGEMQLRALKLALELHGAYGPEVVGFSQEPRVHRSEQTPTIH
jgi:hypothetical protein